MTQPEKVSLGYSDMEIYAKVFDLLSGYLANPDCQNILDDLRKDLKPTTGPSLKMLHQNTLMCEKCPDVISKAKLPSWNLEDPDIMFVSSTPRITEAGMDLFVGGLKELGFSSSRCCLTYALRCEKVDNKYSDQEIENCANYLYGEISHLKPKLIVLMGGNAIKSLTNNSDKQTEIINQIFWLGAWPYMAMSSADYASFSKKNDAQQSFYAGLKTAYEFCYGQ